MFKKNKKGMVIRYLGLSFVITLGVLSTIGSNGGSTGGGSRADVVCFRTIDDSVQIIDDWVRIHSEDSGLYYLQTLTRQTLGSGPVITMDYMVHEPPGIPAALVVLIAGGQLNAGIQVGTGIGSPPSFAGANFLVRSAHLFAAQGYRVLTIDRPSDFSDYIGSSTSGYAYDGYRTSMAHARL